MNVEERRLTREVLEHFHRILKAVAVFESAQKEKVLIISPLGKNQGSQSFLFFIVLLLFLSYLDLHSQSLQPASHPYYQQYGHSCPPTEKQKSSIFKHHRRLTSSLTIKSTCLKGSTKCANGIFSEN